MLTWGKTRAAGAGGTGGREQGIGVGGWGVAEGRRYSKAACTELVVDPA